MINQVRIYPDFSGTQVPAISAGAGQTDFTSTVPFTTNVHLYINGSRQSESTYSFTPNGTTLTYTGAALTGGEEIIIDVL